MTPAPGKRGYINAGFIIGLVVGIFLSVVRMSFSDWLASIPYVGVIILVAGIFLRRDFLSLGSFLFGLGLALTLGDVLQL